MDENHGSSGFTLLEALIALAILSSVSLVSLRATGENLSRIADSGWADRASVLGRDQLLTLKTRGLKGAAQGSFAPDYPEMIWRATVSDVEGGRKIELTVSEGAREISIEEFVFP